MAVSKANDIIIPNHRASWSCTNFKVEKVTHTWTIRNFSFCQEEVGDNLRSPTFFSGSASKLGILEWRLDVYPKAYDEGCEEYLSLFLSLLSGEKKEVKAKFTMGIINNAQERVNVMSKQNVWSFKKKTLWEAGWYDFIKLEDLSDKTKGLLYEDELTLFCDIEIITDVWSALESVDAIQVSGPKCCLLANLGNLLKSQEFSDVSLVVGETTIRAHKHILAAHSPIFLAMFKHDMKEKERNRVDIVDIDEEVLKEMLLFLYTGEVSNIEKVSCGLLAAADKYAIESLKIFCEDALLGNLGIKNAVDILIAADLHGADKLKPHVVNFISINAVAVMKTAGFKSMAHQHPALITELYCKLALLHDGNSHEDSTANGAPRKL